MRRLSATFLATRAMMTPTTMMTTAATRAYAVAPYSAGTDGDVMDLSKKQVVVLDFSAEWCGPCKAIAPQYSLLSEQYSTAKFLTVDVDNNSKLAKVFTIRAVPTFVVLKDGKIVERIEGAAISALKDAIEKASAAPPKK